MKKTYKKGQIVKIISKYLSIIECSDIPGEIVFCNNRSLIVKVNNKLHEIPEEAVLCVVNIRTNNKCVSPKAPKDNKTKNVATVSKSKNKKQAREKLIHYRSITNNIDEISTENIIYIKKSSSTIIYIPPKEDSYSYNCRKETSFGTAHDRAYWALTHPFVGGACCPR